MTTMPLRPLSGILLFGYLLLLPLSCLAWTGQVVHVAVFISDESMVSEIARFLLPSTRNARHIE
jgi:hypothetical protein